LPPFTITVTNPGSGGSGAATLVLCPNAGQTGNYANCAQPAALTFGKQGTGTPSAVLTISVSNCSGSIIPYCSGSGNLTLASSYLSISGPNAADFVDTRQGTCSNGAVVASGSACTVLLQFTPTATSGTNETATLTIGSDAANGTAQTVALSGTSATVTLVSSCQTLNANTNYQLSANVSAAGSCFTVPGANTDLNLNGHTVTYCTASSSAYVGGIFMTGSPTSNTTVHNGAVTEGAGICSGLTAGSGYGSGAIVASSDGNSSTTYGTTVFNVIASVKAVRAKVVLDENAGAGSGHSTVIHDLIYTDSDVYSCNNVGCRDMDQGYPIVMDQSRSAGPTHVYNVVGTGATQGGVVTTAANSVLTNNLISPGNATSTNTNGFAYQDWGPRATVANNLVAGTGVGGSCVSCRGLQVSSIDNVPVTGTIVQGNTFFTTALNNDAEYPGCGSAQEAASFGMQINTAGGTYDLSNNTFQDNKVVVTAGACPGFGFSWSGATNAAGPNKTINNLFECTLASGAPSGTLCAGIRLTAYQYSPHPDNAVASSGDTFIGDTSAIYITYDGTPAWTCTGCTFGKGSNPTSTWLLVDYDRGLSGPTGPSSGPMYLIDPVFINGATKGSNNLAAWAQTNSGLTFSYTIQWTYTVTVTGASSGKAISGATVTATDAQGNAECSGTTNAQGSHSCIVTDTRYAAASGAYSATSSNPFSFTISAGACTSASYSESVLGTTSETRTLGGC
jgi:hypothetical protein